MRILPFLGPACRDASLLGILATCGFPRPFPQTPSSKTLPFLSADPSGDFSERVEVLGALTISQEVIVQILSLFFRVGPGFTGEKNFLFFQLSERTVAHPNSWPALPKVLSKVLLVFCGILPGGLFRTHALGGLHRPISPAGLSWRFFSPFFLGLYHTSSNPPTFKCRLTRSPLASLVGTFPLVDPPPFSPSAPSEESGNCIFFFPPPA